MTENKPRVAVIGAGIFQEPLIECAQRSGYEVHVFAWKAGDPGEESADVFHEISTINKEKILEVCRDLDICGICTAGSDLASLTVSYVAENLGLPGNTIRSSELSTNKYAMRQAFRQAGDPIPGFLEADEESVSDPALTENLNYPLIIKPTDRSGSRGITLIRRPEELAGAAEAAFQESFEKRIMIEEYITGQEYSVEYVSYHGHHHFLALTFKNTTGAPHFIETGHHQPADISPRMLGKVQAVVEHALNTLEITDGASHSEIKIDGETIKIVEIGGRMGGDCIGSHLVPCSTGYDFTKMILDIACGKEPSFTKMHEGFPVSIRFIFNNDDLNQYQNFRDRYPESIVDTDIPDFCPEGAVTDSSTRHGWYVFKDPPDDFHIQTNGEESGKAASSGAAAETEVIKNDEKGLLADHQNDPGCRLSFVIPCYNSAHIIGSVVADIIRTVKARPQYDYEIILVNDGSPDNTFQVISEIAENNDGVTAVNLIRNFGQACALMAGFHYVTGDKIICLDDDGQTDPCQLFRLVDKSNEGYDVVYAKYDSKKHSAFRNFGSKVNDKMASDLIGKPRDLVFTSYFCAERPIIDEVIKYDKPYPYVDGLVMRTTKNVADVPVHHRERAEGESGYSFGKLLSLWLDGFTSFSVKPLRIATLLGFLIALGGFIYGIYCIVCEFIEPSGVSGWASTMAAIILLGGMNMILIGMVGEYVGRIYIAQNNAPQFIVRETVKRKEHRQI